MTEAERWRRKEEVDAEDDEEAEEPEAEEDEPARWAISSCTCALAMLFIVLLGIKRSACSKEQSREGWSEDQSVAMSLMSTDFVSDMF